MGIKPDPILWQAMAREQEISARVARLEGLLAGSRDDGDVRTSVDVARDLSRSREELTHAQERLAALRGERGLIGGAR